MTNNEQIAALTEELRLLREEVKRLREHQNMTTVHIHNPVISKPQPAPQSHAEDFMRACIIHENLEWQKKQGASD